MWWTLWAVGSLLIAAVVALSIWLATRIEKTELLALKEHIRRVLPRNRDVRDERSVVQQKRRRPVYPVSAPRVVQDAQSSKHDLEGRREAVLRAAETQLQRGHVAQPEAVRRNRRGAVNAEIEREASESSSSSASSVFSFEKNDVLSFSSSKSNRELYARHVPEGLAKKIYDLLGYEYRVEGGEPAASTVRDGGYVLEDGDLDGPLATLSDYLRASRGGGEMPRHLGDWNQRFQSAVESLASFSNDNNTPLNVRLRVGRDLINLYQDFIFSSTAYGRIIISEAFLPDQEKTIKPSSGLGGIAGGEKYTVGNILFKFAMDSHNLLGSDYAAAKVAGHELKGLSAVFNAGIPGLSVPLMTLVDYRGFRLIAMSILPISQVSIVYGSNDCGRTVNNTASPEAIHALERLAEHLNIKPHYCGMGGRKAVKVYGPVDLEGHQSAVDGRFYLLDFSRMMPPETPRPGLKMVHLYRLLRPEFVKSYPAPLCSDGYSTFIRAHNAQQHNHELAKATQLLVTEIIPQFAPEFTASLLAEVESKGWRAMEFFRISEALHRRGINIRYLGLLRKHTTSRDVRTFLLVEIFARVIKNLLKLLLREKMKALRIPLEEPYRRIVVDYLNLLFGESEKSDLYWNTVIRRSTVTNFPDALSLEEQQENFYIKPMLTNFSSPDCDGKYLLFCRIAAMSGLQISPALQKDLYERPNSWAPRGDEPFDDADLTAIEVRVKHMGIINHTQGFLYLTKAIQKQTEPATSERLLRLALAKFQEALETDVRNPDILCNIALVSLKLLECTTARLTADVLDENDPEVQAIEGFFLRAVHEAPKDSKILSKVLFHYANFLDRMARVEEAEDYYLKALECDPTNDAALLEYGNFLQGRGMFELAEQYYAKMTSAQAAAAGERR